MRHVTENFANRKVTNEFSQEAKQAKQEIVENNQKIEQMKKIKFSPVADKQKISEPEQIVKKHKQITNEVENDSVKENKQCYIVFKNKSQNEFNNG